MKKIKLKNIRSYEDGEIVFPEGTILLSGDIGAGKTSVLLAIEFALFGLQPGQRATALLRHGTNEGSVTLEFEIDGKQVIIERKLKRGKKSISQENASITIDGQRRELSVTELKNLVLGLLNYPQEFARKTNLLYRFTVYTPQEEMKQIILENAETRLNTLIHVFGIDKYKRIRENTDLFTSKLREEIRMLDAMISDLDEKRRELKERNRELEEARAKSKLLAGDLEKIRRELLEIENKLREIEKEIEKKRNYEKEIEKFRVAIATKKEQILMAEQERKKLETELKELAHISFDREKVKGLEEMKREKQNVLDAISNRITSLISEINLLKAKNHELDEKKRKILEIEKCPTCLQDLSSGYKETIMINFDNQITGNKKKIEELEKKLKEMEKRKQDASAELERIARELEQEKINEVRANEKKKKEERLEHLRKNIEVQNKDIEMLNKQIVSLRELVLELSKFDNLYEETKKRYEEIVTRERKHEIMLAEINKQAEMLEKEIELLAREIARKEGMQEYMIKLKALEQWLSSDFMQLVALTEKSVLATLRSEFSRLLEKWFTMLVPEGLSIRLDEDFTPIIEQQGYETDYAHLSGGERTAVALAYRLALNQVINSLMSKIKTRDIVILDEPTDGFSSEQLDKMRNVLEELNVKQLILVSHETKIESFVDHVIKFRKENGATSVVG